MQSPRLWYLASDRSELEPAPSEYHLGGFDLPGVAKAADL